jgi:hypothetical protein
MRDNSPSFEAHSMVILAFDGECHVGQLRGAQTLIR